VKGRGSRKRQKKRLKRPDKALIKVAGVLELVLLPV
jgi:hypothetical protein